MRSAGAARARPEPRVHFIKKVDGSPLIQSEAKTDSEDEFSTFTELLNDKAPIAPPVNPIVLAAMIEKNNILPSLIDAMETSIECTGAELIAVESDEMEEDSEAEGEMSEDDEAAKEQEEKAKERKTNREKAGLQSWFDEPWPGETFLTQRRRLRRDQEGLGNAYLEVIRNANDEIVMWRVIDAKKVRMIKLDDPVTVEKTIVRDGREFTANVMVAERRYVQKLGSKLVWFKEFGASRDLNKRTGDWADGGPAAQEGARLPVKQRASELIHFRVRKDPLGTPYGLPRWWSNAPSVVGSRKAEEFNLEFWEAGGVPPLLVLVAGGRLAAGAEQALKDHFCTTGPNRHQAAVMEAFSPEGDIDDKGGAVRVTVERFGSERQKDSMFEGYIEKCDNRVRRSFRLPAIFLGEGETSNFATAVASMMVAEAQVFAPERKEFDEVVNLKLMPLLPNGDKFEYRSNSLAMRDVAQVISALGLITDAVERESLVDAVNEITNLELKAKEEEEPVPPGMMMGPDGELVPDPAAAPPGMGGPPGAAGGQPGPQNQRPDASTGSPSRRDVQRAEVLTGLHVLAEDAGRLFNAGLTDADVPRAVEIAAVLPTLTAAESGVFRELVAKAAYPAFEADPEGAAELGTCVLAKLTALAAARGTA